MNVLDLVLVLAAASFGWSGYRQGFVVGALSFGGFVGGGVVGMLAAPRLVGGWQAGAGQALAAVAVVIVLATIGQVLLTLVGAQVRKRMTWRPARVLDAALGAAMSVVAVLLVAWFVGYAVRQAPAPGLQQAVKHSRLLTTVDRAMPDGPRGLFSSFRNLLDEDDGFSRVFSGLAPERIRPVEAPDASVAATAAVHAARQSILKVSGAARQCDRQIEGSGFVYAPEHVLTNAHVVAGVAQPTVRDAGGRSYDARVVAYDPRRDLAVLHVPLLEAPILRFDATAKRGDNAVVAGFPRGGPYRLDAARVREEISARGPDIYGRTQVTRSVFSLYTTVQPGNSGGPLLSPAGRVYGVIFAKSVDDNRTGYALTVEETQRVARPAERATTPVETGSCAE